MGNVGDIWLVGRSVDRSDGAVRAVKSPEPWRHFTMAMDAHKARVK